MKVLTLIALICFSRRSYGNNQNKPQSIYDQSLIVGGSDTSISERPMMAQLVIPLIFRGPQQLVVERACSGTVLNDLYVLTSGHCLIGADNIRIIVGFTNTTNPVPYYFSSETHIHESYKNYATDYDIGLVKSNTSMKLGPNLQPARLASSTETVKLGEMLSVVGWGKIAENGKNYSSILQEVQLPVVDFSKCQTLYGKMHNLTSRSFCAGYMEGGKGVCMGDLGGAAINDKGIQVGIVSTHLGCGRQGYPPIFTNIAPLRDWIKSIAGV